MTRRIVTKFMPIVRQRYVYTSVNVVYNSNVRRFVTFLTDKNGLEALI